MEQKLGLSVVAANRLIDGGDYRDDGFVYLNNKPVAKWHAVFSGIRVWGPKLNNLKYLYSVYQKTEADLDKNSKEINDLLKKIHSLHLQSSHDDDDFFIVHAFDSKWKKWVLMEVSYNKKSEEPYSYSVIFLDKTPEVIMFPEEGQSLYNTIISGYAKAKRFSKVAAVFRSVLNNNLPETNKFESLCIKADNNYFIFQSHYKHGGWSWEFVRSLPLAAYKVMPLSDIRCSP